MQPENQTPEDYNKPVAYDNQGRPLYAHPPMPERSQETTQPVYVTRPLEPASPEVTPEILAKHEESCKKYPQLNLSEGEYIISAVRRHPIGLVPIIGFTGFMVLFCLVSIPFYASYHTHAADASSLPSVAIAAVVAILLSLLFIVGGYIAVYIYINNKFFLTNESVIQEIQLSLFSKHEQTVSLGSIEDASYYQKGVLQYLFNYGRIRLSTMGDETTYRFSYVTNPKQQIALLNNAVESFKNGRPVRPE